MSETSSHSSKLEDREYYTALAHFYRGEVGRIMVWRQRLDTTTNWAILSATGLITFALSHAEIPHVIFMIGNIMVFLLLIIEGRRFRYYDAYLARVRILEAHFLASVLLHDKKTVQGNWRELLAEDLLLPSFKIGVRESTAQRLKANYIWIFLVLLLAWVLKIYLHGSATFTTSVFGPIPSWKDFFLKAQSSQPFHPVLFWGSFLSFYGMLIWLTFYSEKDRYTAGEMQRAPRTRQRWRI